MKINNPCIRLLLLIFAFFISISFIGCTQEKKYKIGISQCSTDDWRTKMNEEIMRELIFHDNVEVEIRSADDDNSRQIADIRYFADNGFDVIIAAPNEADALTPIIKEVYDRGTPIILFDRNIHSDSFTSFIGADNKALGRSAADLAASYFSGGDHKIIEIQGLKGSTPAEDRHSGFAERISQIPNLAIAATAHGDWNDSLALRVADSMLAIVPDAALIYAHNDRMAVAARQAVEKRGLPGVRIIGIDGAPGIGMKAVADSIIDATFIYPTAGDSILRTAISIIEGKQTPHLLNLPSDGLVDKRNAALLIAQNSELQKETDKIMTLKGMVDNYWQQYSSQTSLLYAVIIITVLLGLLIFILLKAYWSRKRDQNRLAEQNHELELQRDNLSELNRKLEEATTSKLNFFTNVSHDLRTPLTLIASPLQTLSRDTSLAEKDKSLIALARKNVRILQRLINQILDFQKFESGRLELRLVKADICGCFREWTAAFEEAARNRGIKLRLDIRPDDRCVCDFDREKVERIFFNLMSNAFRFTPKNGTVTVSLVTSAADTISFSITDTGKGIPEENIPHLFERFFQGREGNAGGSGIGLVVVKSFVELHGGEIIVESSPQVGTVFTVTIPKRNSPEVESPSETSSAAFADIAGEIGEIELPTHFNNRNEEDTQRPTILIIDDNEDIRLLLRTLLSGEYDVITAPSGESGVKAALKYVPDCVVCDVMMPGMDGLEVTKCLKSEMVTCHIPVILLTAKALDEQRAKGYDAGADGYVSKPFDDEVLLSRIKSVIANRKLLKDSWASAVASKSAYTAHPAKPSPSDPFSELDSTFYRDFVNIVEKGLEDPEFNVEEIASQMGMSRVQLYRKLKALTNYTPVDLLKIFRLRRAKELLGADDAATVAEIAYRSGFSSPSYFTKCFREYFGELPSEYQARTSRL